MKKKLLIISGILVVVIFMLLFVGTGFGKCSNVYLGNYSLSEDGSILTMNVQIMSSMGYIPDFSVNQDGYKKYITFYSAFGGLNGKIGAKNTFQIELNPSCTEIYFCDATGECRLILQKNEMTKEWVYPMK